MKAMLAALILVVFTLLPPAQAQQPARLPRIGFLIPVGSGSAGPSAAAFRQGLAGVGYVDGQNVVIEQRSAEGKFERFPELAAELAGLKVDVVALIGAVTARAVKKVVTNIPTVFVIVVDPVADGVVANARAT